MGGERGRGGFRIVHDLDTFNGENRVGATTVVV